MSDTEALPRPRQVTLAAGLALLAAALMVVFAFDAMAQVRSVQTRADVADVIGRLPGSGVGVGEVVRLLRVLVLVDAALAAAAVVLAVFVLQRHRAARVTLTVVAAVLLITSPADNVVLAVVLAVAVSMLWSQPARDWFAGRKPRPVPVPAERRPDQPAANPWSPPASDSRLADEAAPQPGPSPYPFGTPPGAQVRPPGPVAPQGGPEGGPPQQPAPQQQPYGQAHPQPGYATGGYPAPGGYPAYGYPDPGRRPGSVTAAAWITWVFAGLTLAGYVLLLVVMVAGRDLFLQAVRQDPQVTRSGLTTNQIISSLWVLGVVVILWSLAAIVFAVLAYRRFAWARVTLAVSAGMTALLALVLTLFGSPVMLLPAVAGGAVVALLFSRGANAWYAGRGPGGPRGPSGPPAPSYGPGAWPPPQPLQQRPSGQQPPAGQPGEQPKPPKNVW